MRSRTLCCSAMSSAGWASSGSSSTASSIGAGAESIRRLTLWISPRFRSATIGPAAHLARRQTSASVSGSVARWRTAKASACFELSVAITSASFGRISSGSVRHVQTRVPACFFTPEGTTASSAWPHEQA